MDELNIETKKAYAEILEVLKVLPKEYVDKVPPQIINLFEEEKMNGYAIMFDNSNLISKDSLRAETLELLAMLNYQYWCDDESLKNKFYEIYSLNDEIGVKEKLNIEGTVKQSQEECLQMVVVKDNFFTRLIEKIKLFFKKLTKSKDSIQFDWEV